LLTPKKQILCYGGRSDRADTSSTTLSVRCKGFAFSVHGRHDVTRDMQNWANLCNDVSEFHSNCLLCRMRSHDVQNQKLLEILSHRPVTSDLISFMAVNVWFVHVYMPGVLKLIGGQQIIYEKFCRFDMIKQENVW
jgi:hypothetical protein